ncbi:ubiquinol-cytochrome-c reductase complex assembly factor 2 isoform X1 [Zalophus californianus]|uniref:Mitochondrial nucleoid factor 1 n=1 Tax=Zalophus californianus TaxID=9704 RepID=A0A6J2DKL5_ZALCA|nr:ubiquinol-cytochrome-c reductase complex assembly factor 2 isoform X1 [Zalophus californianus]
MAASRYRRFLKLCEEWPVDETKRGRDLGAYLRQRVAQAFREGENTQIAEPEACDQMYESLARLHSNYYKHKYPRPRDTSFSGLSVEEYKLILSTAFQQLSFGDLESREFLPSEQIETWWCHRYCMSTLNLFLLQYSGKLG